MAKPVKSRLKGVFALLLLATLGALPTSYAQSTNDKPLNVVIPFAPGGGTDVLTRMVMPKVADKLGVTAVIENRPGAAGAIGAQFVARAAADGKTLLVGSVSEIGVNPSIYPKLAYNVERDFVAVTALAAAPMVLVVHPSSQVKVAGDLVKLAQANPGKINFGSAGTGSGAHMAAELFIFETKIKLTHVPYKGTGAVAADMLGQQRDMVMFAPLPAVAGIVRSGQLKAIALTGKTRSAAMPEVPTFIEAGIPGFDMDYWYGLMAPAGTPTAVRNALHLAALEVLSKPEMVADLLKQGLVPTITTEKEFADFVQADMAKWAQVVKAADIKADQ
jgi:tripartite-type tricarboxylate transporter receptor subunit TctC